MSDLYIFQWNRDYVNSNGTVSGGFFWSVYLEKVDLEFDLLLTPTEFWFSIFSYSREKTFFKFKR